MKDPVIRTVVICLAAGLALLGWITYLYLAEWPHG